MIDGFHPMYTASKIRDVYAFLAQNYEEGDEIFMFGCVDVSTISPLTDADIPLLIASRGELLDILTPV